MALLEYDIRVTGARNVDAALASIERRFVQHNARVGRATGARGARAQNPATAMAATERATVASAERTARAEERIKERFERRKIAMQNRYFAEEQRKRDQAERKSLAAARRENEARVRFAHSTFGRSADRVFGTARAVGTMGAAMVGIGGAGLAASALAGATKSEDRARRLVIAGRAPGGEGAMSVDQVRRQVNAAGIAHGLSPEDVMAGPEKFVEKTGDLAGAMRFLDTFAATAQAANSSMEDVASVGAEMAKKFNIKTAEDMQQAFANLIFQGKKNSFVLKDMAPLLTGIMASMKGQAGLQGVGGMKVVGGLMQMAKEGTGSPEEAATALENVMKQLVSKSKEIQQGKFGSSVKIFEGGNARNPMRDLMQIIPELVQSTKGDITKLNDIFEIRGSRAFNPITGAYRTAYSGAKGTEKEREAAGLKAAKESLAYFVETPGAKWEEVKKDEAEAVKSVSVQMEVLATQMKEAVASELFPEFIKLAPTLKQLVPVVATATKVFGEVVKFFLAHPLSGIGAVIAGQIAADLAKAKIGSIARAGVKAIAEEMSAGGGGFGGLRSRATPTFTGLGFSKDSGATAAGALGAAGIGALLGGGLALSIVSSGVVNLAAAEVNMTEAGKGVNAVRDAGLGDIDAVREEVRAQRKRVNDLKPGSRGEQMWDWMTGGSKATELKTQQAFLDEEETKLGKLEELNDAAEKLKAAGTAQEEANKKLAALADKIGIKVNRSDGPSTPGKT